LIVAVVEPRRLFWNPEEEEYSPLRAVTRQKLVKKQQAEKTGIVL
jgi:hypothetical protein